MGDEIESARIPAMAYDSKHPKPYEQAMELLWIAEAESRYLEYKAGRIQAFPAEQVFTDARRAIKSARKFLS